MEAETRYSGVCPAPYEHLLLPPGGVAGVPDIGWASVPSGCFTYEPPAHVKWAVHVESAGQSCLKTQNTRLKIVNARVLPRWCSWRGFCGRGLALALLVTGCAGPRPLKGGKATTTRSHAGLIQQTVAQGENASQPSKQDQETIKVRSTPCPQRHGSNKGPRPLRRLRRCVLRTRTSALPVALSRAANPQHSTLNPHPSPSPQPPTS